MNNQSIQSSAQSMDPDLYIPGQGQIKHGVTVFLFGPIGTIKTTWAGTWPSPVFLSAGQEGGDDSLSMLPQITGCATPPVYMIDNCKKMLDKVEFICNHYERFGWKTVVFDSITFYADLWIRELTEVRIAQGKKKKGEEDYGMQMRDWGFLEAHLCKDLAQRLHKTKLNVIWIALQKEKGSVNPDGTRIVESVEPMVPGSSAIKLPAMCKMVIHADKKLTADPNNPGRMISTPVYYTAPSHIVKLPRHKYGNSFAEGCLVDSQYGTWPTFRAVDERIGQFIYK